MGMLPGQFGQWGYTSNPYSSARTSMALGIIATGENVFGNIMEGVGGYQQARFAASVAEQNRDAILQAGQTNESSIKMRYGALASEQKAAQAANGVNVNSGSPLAVRQSTQEVGAIDAAIAHYNTLRAAFGQDVQAQIDKKAATNALFKGLYGAGASFISGAAGQAGRYGMYQQTGAFMRPGGFNVPQDSEIVPQISTDAMIPGGPS